MFYSYIRSKQRNTVAVSRVYNASGDLTQDDSETAKTLCDQFQKVFVDNSDDDLLHYVSNFQSSNNELSASELFTEEIVYKKLCLLKENKSLGPDAIHPHLLKNCADLLVIPLTYIFRKSFQDSCLPDDWKRANVTPLHKKGSRLDVNNFRPVSLTCVSCKIMESVI